MKKNLINNIFLLTILFVAVSKMHLVKAAEPVLGHFAIGGMSLELEQYNDYLNEIKEYAVKLYGKDELSVLYRIVQAEIGDYSEEQKINVACVILNRVNSDEFPNSIEKVVFQKLGGSMQFSPVKDGRYWTVKPTKETKIAVHKAIYEYEDYNAKKCRFFKSIKTKSKFFETKLDKIFDDGAHDFWR